MEMDNDYYGATEPIIDVVQMSDAQTQTDSTTEQNILLKLHSLENQINVLREDCQRDREMQNAFIEKTMKKMLSQQKILMDKFFPNSKTQITTTMTKDWNSWCFRRRHLERVSVIKINVTRFRDNDLPNYDNHFL